MCSKGVVSCAVACVRCKPVALALAFGHASQVSTSLGFADAFKPCGVLQPPPAWTRNRTIMSHGADEASFCRQAGAPWGPGLSRSDLGVCSCWPGDHAPGCQQSQGMHRHLACQLSCIYAIPCWLSHEMHLLRPCTRVNLTLSPMPAWQLSGMYIGPVIRCITESTSTHNSQGHEVRGALLAGD